jgi:hypothetical protein
MVTTMQRIENEARNQKPLKRVPLIAFMSIQNKAVDECANIKRFAMVLIR